MRLVSAGFVEKDGESIERSLTSNRLGWLGGVAVEGGSLRQMRRLGLTLDEPERKQLGLLASLVSTGQLYPQRSGEDKPGKHRQFGLAIALPDDTKDVVGVVAKLTADSTLQVAAVALSRHSKPRALNSEAADMKARLETLQAAVVAADLGPDIEQAYSDTAQFVNHWMNKTGRGCVLDVRGNVAELLSAIHAYVGKASYYGSNAECVLRAFDGEPVITAPRPRTIDPGRPDWMTDPLGLTPSESEWLRYNGGPKCFNVIETHFEKLLELFDRTSVIRYAGHIGLTNTFAALIAVTTDLRDARFTDEEIDLVADRGGAASVLLGMHAALPLLRQRKVSKQQIMAAATKPHAASRALQDLVISASLQAAS